MNPWISYDQFVVQRREWHADAEQRRVAALVALMRKSAHRADRAATRAANARRRATELLVVA